MGLLLVDGDILIKAAHWRLLDEIPGFACTRWIETCTNASLIFRARRSDARLFKTAEAAKDLHRCLSQTAELPQGDQHALVALQGSVGIDGGEALLLSALCADPTAVLLSGDKRAIRALSSPGLEFVCDRIRGRVYCLEQFLLHVVSVRGAPFIVDRIQPFRALDTAVHCVLGSTPQPTDAALQAGLNSYILDIQSECGGLLGPSHR